MHQMHHSAERVDIWGAFYFHPLDMVGWVFLGSLCLVGIVGLTPEATLIVSIMAVFCAMFQHANLKTPYWLGFIVTRPESHALHHERGVHAWNYGDIRSEEHTSELQSLMRISYAVLCLKKHKII